MVVVLVVSIVRKVAQSEWDCSLTKKKEKNIGATAIARRLRADDLFERAQE